MDYTNPRTNPSNKHNLRIGYIWEYESGGLSALMATTLHVKAVIQGLEKLGHQVRMITYCQGQPCYSDDLVVWKPIKSIERSITFRASESFIRGIQSRLHLPYFNLFNSYHFADACMAVAADCDILYERFWMLASGGMHISRRLGIPIIYEVNGDLVEEYRQQGLRLSWVQWKVIHRLNRYMFENSGKVVTVSDTLRKKIVKRLQLRTHKVVAVDNGAKIDLFTNPVQECIERTRLHYRLNKGAVVIFVGTFKPWHGIDLLVEAFGQVASFHPSAKLLLVGEGPLKNQLIDQVAALQLKDKVIFTGLVEHEQVPALLGAADIAVLNPRLTGASIVQSPLKLFEYMAAGKAVIAPRIPNNELILSDRQDGLLVSPDDPEALAEAILELLRDKQLRLRLGETARRRAIEHHSWDRTVSEIEAIMYSLKKDVVLNGMAGNII